MRDSSNAEAFPPRFDECVGADLWSKACRAAIEAPDIRVPLVEGARRRTAASWDSRALAEALLREWAPALA